MPNWAYDIEGYTKLNADASTPVPSNEAAIIKNKFSPPLSRLLDVLREQGSPAGQPTEISIVINGKSEKSILIIVHDLSELQEILQWTIGRR